MSSYVLRINEANLVAKRLIDYLKSLSETNSYIEIMPQVKEQIIGKKLAQKNILENITAGLEEVNQFKRGNLETTFAKDFLNEL